VKSPMRITGTANVFEAVFQVNIVKLGRADHRGEDGHASSGHRHSGHFRRQRSRLTVIRPAWARSSCSQTRPRMAPRSTLVEIPLNLVK